MCQIFPCPGLNQIRPTELGSAPARFVNINCFNIEATVTELSNFLYNLPGNNFV